jgi:hypothetical protein
MLMGHLQQQQQQQRVLAGDAEVTAELIVLVKIDVAAFFALVDGTADSCWPSPAIQHGNRQECLVMLLIVSLLNMLLLFCSSSSSNCSAMTCGFMTHEKHLLLPERAVSSLGFLMDSSPIGR